ncbi:unnamed protein product [Parascedosporium putredinis]|uniref:Nucleosome assembly protein n=1 Tax=Parascedosporium putredinis TaxID=1442378 RepID=A0A9P1M732_9PEZI|nr:unnamed protein product [Parascedosporium putredinis]CAI7987268.1 unnamed protein product [Parascedosporium putredinis]
MAEPIPNKRPESGTAPTPQNTPANNAPISSHAQQPGVASIKEEDLDRAAASIFAQDPRILQMIQGRLGSLVGRSSGYIESLPPSVRRRVAGLKGIQTEHAKLEAEFQEEVLQLEKKYFAKFTPLYEKRASIVNGKAEPSDEEIQQGEKADDDSGDNDQPPKAVEKETDSSSESVSGIPEFWLSAMKNQISLAEMITDRDEAALKHLFSDNDFFTNQAITKTYFYQTESGYGGDFIYDHAEGDKIEWKSGRDLTVRTESKKQRNKNTKQTRVVKKTVPTESFFNFFSPPIAPEDDEEEADPDIEIRLELDYQLGEDIKEKLIPRAIDWFTGEALQYEEMDDEDLEGIQYDDDDDDDDDDDASDDQDEEEDSDDEDDAGRPNKEAAECKQS